MLIQKKLFIGSTLPFWGIIWEFALAVLFAYTFFVQNVLVNISGMLMLLCAMLFGFYMLNLIINRKWIVTGNCMWGIIAFVCIGLMNSFIFSNNIQDSLDVGLRMIEYLIIACSLCSFLISYPQRLFSMLWYIWIAITLLCIAVLTTGTEVTAAGAIGLETLNVNLLSCFITFQIYTALVLMVKAKKMGKIIYTASIIMALLIQVLTASRRGFIIATFFCILAVFCVIIPRYTKKYSARRVTWVALLLGVVIIVIVYLGSYILHETTLGVRFSGKFVSGDTLRNYYKVVARQQFEKHPILGVGLNGLESIMGVYSHSLYYETLACTGLVGAIALFATLLLLGKKIFKNTFRTVSHDPDDLYVSRLSLLFFLVAIGVSGVVVTMIYDFWFYICLGILVAVTVVNREKRSDTIV